MLLALLLALFQDSPTLQSYPYVSLGHHSSVSVGTRLYTALWVSDMELQIAAGSTAYFVFEFPGAGLHVLPAPVCVEGGWPGYDGTQLQCPRNCRGNASLFLDIPNDPSLIGYGFSWRAWVLDLGYGWRATATHTALLVAGLAS